MYLNIKETNLIFFYENKSLETLNTRYLISTIIKLFFIFLIDTFRFLHCANHYWNLKTVFKIFLKMNS